MALGGSESSLVRIADALDAHVVQHNRVNAVGRYMPPAKISGIANVVVSRDSRALMRAREFYPDARFFLWMHDLVRPGSKRGRRLASTAALLRELKVTIICVSDFQRLGVDATLDRMGMASDIRTCTIYNALDPLLGPDDTAVDNSKLVFFSSPNKVLTFTLDAFGALRRAIPDLRLMVGNPGYKSDRHSGLDGVTFLGPQPQARIHEEVRSALCTFCPNFVIPETFGLVFAESMALGTPVLTHECGSAREVIRDGNQLLPVTTWHRAYERAMRGVPSQLRGAPAKAAAHFGLFDAYIERVRLWRSGARPQCGADPRFRLASVAEQWRSLMSSDAS